MGARRPGQRRRAPERNGARAALPTAAGAGDPWQRAGLVAAMLPGLAAVAALVFTWVSVWQVSQELTISQQGQSADRFDRAIERLDDGSANIRRGAVFSLQGVMEDYPRLQPAVISALSEYIHDHASKKPVTPDKAPDIQAALSVLGQRDPAHDRGRAIDLRGVRLDDIDLRRANLGGANLAGAVLSHSNLEGSVLSGADLHGAVLNATVLTGADLSNARLDSARLRAAVLVSADLRNASLHKADLRKADLTDADLGGADLSAAELAGVDGDPPTSQPSATPGSPRPAGPRDAAR
ncbi:pentapeptide repeat-containing protein [Streptomyces sp. NBC_00201]|uniref:pentapeptide repeat-containing protein n=1 Tax=unclassified Streptomyces TaxID=2593676 RepID=UPI00225B2040|nr:MULTISPECIES: pentapeptide repeat-containing protein [unclassified Streptomyces]MCX5056328.1 pentapeptide repeat-containing protein [Streptomyces sp. NBC_00452]MCX5246773.1 pentapeptide repeat-containing protein [Streptomyces sp. NBC_00201]